MKDFLAHTLFSSILPLVAEFLLFPPGSSGMQLGLGVRHQEQGQFNLQSLSLAAAQVVPRLETRVHIPVTRQKQH